MMSQVSSKYSIGALLCVLFLLIRLRDRVLCLYRAHFLRHIKFAWESHCARQCLSSNDEHISCPVDFGTFTRRCSRQCTRYETTCRSSQSENTHTVLTAKQSTKNVHLLWREICSIFFSGLKDESCQAQTKNTHHSKYCRGVVSKVIIRSCSIRPMAV
jgi:hypothetical protein